MKAKIIVCNFIAVVMAIISLYILLDALISEGDLLASIYMFIMTLVGSITYHYIGKTA